MNKQKKLKEMFALQESETLCPNCKVELYYVDHVVDQWVFSLLTVCPKCGYPTVFQVPTNEAKEDAKEEYRGEEIMKTRICYIPSQHAFEIMRRLGARDLQLFIEIVANACSFESVHDYLINKDWELREYQR